MSTTKWRKPHCPEFQFPIIPGISLIIWLCLNRLELQGWKTYRGWSKGAVLTIGIAPCAIWHDWRFAVCVLCHTYKPLVTFSFLVVLWRSQTRSWKEHIACVTDWSAFKRYKWLKCYTRFVCPKSHIARRIGHVECFCPARLSVCKHPDIHTIEYSRIRQPIGLALSTHPTQLIPMQQASANQTQSNNPAPTHPKGNPIVGQAEHGATIPVLAVAADIKNKPQRNSGPMFFFAMSLPVGIMLCCEPISLRKRVVDSHGKRFPFPRKYTPVSKIEFSQRQILPT